MSHDASSHSHAPANYTTAFTVGIGLNVLYIVVEIIVGFSIDSIALIADAGHNISDVMALLLAWGASALAATKPTVRRTYGLRRTTILASLVNAIVLLIVIGAIAWEAIRRFSQPEEVPGITVMWTAGIGILVNLGTALLFMKGRERDINIRGAFLHMAADAAVSAGVLVAGLAILLTGAQWIDPLTSLLVVLVIALGTWGLLRESITLAIDAVPENIDPDKVRDYLLTLPGVDDVHDLHIWAMSTTEIALTAHLMKPEPMGDDALLQEAARELHHKFEIVHTTIQFERSPGCVGCGTV
jgi:cobalt-zinc-cadmium efflux system protein